MRTMGGTRVLLCLGLLMAVFYIVAVDGKECPPPHKVYSHKPVCRDNYDCKQGKLCCPNGTGLKSCAEPVAWGQGGGKYNEKDYKGGPGRYCGNTKCSAFQKCIVDKYGRHSCK